MKVFRIALSKWANLTASGKPARWNPMGTFMIYTSSSLALACLENLVHRSGEGLAENFSAMTIDIQDSFSLTEITEDQLPSNWTNLNQYGFTQKLGKAWVENQTSLVLKVPSALVGLECNYLINPMHPEFISVTLEKTTPFKFDSRFM